MRKQQKIWQLEHKKPEILPSLEYLKASSGVYSFVSYLKSINVSHPLKIVDIGCGKGRNAIYLAEQGFEVYGMDYIKLALNYTQESAKKNNVADKVHLSLVDIGQKWPFKNNFFDIAIDCFSSIDIETKQGREIYKKEMLRTLKFGGYSLVMVVSVNDEIEGEFIRKHPCKEKNSTIWSGNGKFQKNYDEDELREFYKDFEIIQLKEIKKPAFKLGKKYTATNYWMVLRKKVDS